MVLSLHAWILASGADIRTLLDKMVFKESIETGGVTQAIGQTDAHHSPQLLALRLLKPLQEHYQL